jgi:hypothetical protein
MREIIIGIADARRSISVVGHAVADLKNALQRSSPELERLLAGNASRRPTRLRILEAC